MSELFQLLLVRLRLASNVFLLHVFPVLPREFSRQTGLVHIITALQAKKTFIWSQMPQAQLYHICAKGIVTWLCLACRSTANNSTSMLQVEKRVY